jgi:hypothetical protein
MSETDDAVFEKTQAAMGNKADGKVPSLMWSERLAAS